MRVSAIRERFAGELEAPALLHEAEFLFAGEPAEAHKEEALRKGHPALESDLSPVVSRHASQR